MNWNSESSGVNRSVSADALITEAMRDEGDRRMHVTIADDLTAASDSELPTAIGRAMNNGGGADPARRVVCQSLTELIGSLKSGNVWVLVQLIHRPTRTKNQLNKNPTLPDLRLPISSDHCCID